MRIIKTFLLLFGAVAFSSPQCPWNIIPGYEWHTHPFDNTTMAYIKSKEIRYVEVINRDSSQYYFNSMSKLDSFTFRTYQLDEDGKQQLDLWGKNHYTYDSVGRLTSKVCTDYSYGHLYVEETTITYGDSIIKEKDTYKMYLDGRRIDRGSRTYKYKNRKEENYYTRNWKRWPYLKTHHVHYKNGDYYSNNKRQYRSESTDTINGQILKEYNRVYKTQILPNLQQYEVFDMTGLLLYTSSGNDSTGSPIIRKRYSYDSNNNLVFIKDSCSNCYKTKTDYFHRLEKENGRLEYKVTIYEESNNGCSILDRNDTTYYNFHTKNPTL